MYRFVLFWKMLFRRVAAFFSEWQYRRIFYEVYYINGEQSLPPPLGAEEEKRYLEEMARPETALEARNILVEHNLRLVVFLAKKFENTGVMTEDLISIGTIGLIKGITSFRADKNIKLATYASKCIENEILMFLRKGAHRKNEVSIDEPLNVDFDGNELLLGDILGSSGEEIHRELEREEDRQALFRAISGLSEREREIISMRFGLGGKKEMTQKEVAVSLGISQSYISRLEKKILLKLRSRMLQSEKSSSRT